MSDETDEGREEPAISAPGRQRRSGVAGYGKGRISTEPARSLSLTLTLTHSHPSGTATSMHPASCDTVRICEIVFCNMSDLRMSPNQYR